MFSVRCASWFLFLPLLVIGLVSGCATAPAVTVEATVRPSALPQRPISYWLSDADSQHTLANLRFNALADEIRPALAALGWHAAATADAADIVVELGCELGPPRVDHVTLHESAFGRPLSPRERRGPPPEGVTAALMGYSSTADLHYVRDKRLSVCAREIRPRRPGVPPNDLWRVDVTIATEGDDLRRELPRLAAVAGRHIGHTTLGPVTVQLPPSDALSP